MAQNRWRPGQSGNPKGRPPRNKAFTELLRRKLDSFWRLKEVDPVTGAETVRIVHVGEELCRVLIGQALRGEEWAFKYMIDRLEGKPTTVAEMEQTLQVLSGDEARNRILEKLEQMSKNKARSQGEVPNAERTGSSH